MDSAINLPVVLISIHPHHAEAILSGIKKVELRRVPIREEFEFLALYATAPVKGIVGFCRVSRVVSAPPSLLWEEFGVFPESLGRPSGNTTKAVEKDMHL